MCPQQQQAWRMCVVTLLNSRHTKTAAVHAAVSNSQTYWPSTTVRDGGDGHIYGRPISREFTSRQPPNVGNFTYDLKLYLQEVKTRPRTLNFGGESWESPPVACRSEIITHGRYSIDIRGPPRSSLLVIASVNGPRLL